MDLNGYPKVLVLNATFTTINICSWRRAMILLCKEKAVQVEKSGKLINGKYELPIIIRLVKYVPLPYKEAILSRKNIYLRDNHTCQYCGKSGNLTIDHVMPRSRGGEDRWENVVASCVRCNNKKSDRTPEEAGMKLKGVPFKPPSSLYLQITRLNNVPKSWSPYFFRVPK